MLLHLAIMLSSISALTRAKTLWVAGAVSGVFGLYRMLKGLVPSLAVIL